MQNAAAAVITAAIAARPPREPEDIRPLMQDWRDGLSLFPQEYNVYHYSLAQARIAEFLEMGLCIGKPETVNDGCGDGFRPMQVQAVTPSGRRLSLKWNDSTRDFMVAREGCGGHGMLFLKDLL
jgi:hypothetical protein